MMDAIAARYGPVWRDGGPWPKQRHQIETSDDPDLDDRYRNLRPKSPIREDRSHLSTEYELRASKLRASFSRTLGRHQTWLASLPCPVIRLDGASPLSELVTRVVAALES